MEPDIIDLETEDDEAEYYEEVETGGGDGNKENSLPQVVRFDVEVRTGETRQERITRKSGKYWYYW